MDTYAHVTPTMQRAAADRFADAVGAENETAIAWSLHTAKTKRRQPAAQVRRRFWWGWLTGPNPRQPGSQPGALPTELQPPSALTDRIAVVQSQGPL